jgi:hypothetical protein
VSDKCFYSNAVDWYCVQILHLVYPLHPTISIPFWQWNALVSTINTLPLRMSWSVIPIQHLCLLNLCILCRLSLSLQCLSRFLLSRILLTNTVLYF